MALFRRSSSVPGARIDPTLGHPVAGQAMALAEKGDVDGLSPLLRDADLDLLGLLLDVISKALPLDTAEAWAQRSPDDPDALVVLGEVLVNRASDTRGSGPGTDLSNKQIIGFQDGMARARVAYEKAAALVPDDPTPWAGMLVTCYASRNKADMAAFTAAVRQRDPLNTQGLRTAIDLFGEKWYGEPGEAFALARDISAAAPEGAEVHVVIADAYVEQWVNLRAFRNDARGAKAMLASSSVRDEILGSAQASVLSPAHVPSAISPWVHNAYAFAFTQGGQHDLAAPHFAAVDGLVAPRPWGYLGGDPVQQWSKAQRKAA